MKCIWTILILFILLPVVVQAEDRWNIKTEENYQVYIDASVDSLKLLEGTEVNIYETTGIVSDFFVIDVEGTVGYISIKQATSIFEQDVLNFKVVEETVPFYTKQKGNLVQRGTITKDMVLTRTKALEGYHEFQNGGELFYIPEASTIPTSEKPIAQKTKQVTYPMRLYNRIEAPVFNDKNIQIGSLATGQSVDLLHLSNSKGVISFLGQEAHINMKDFVHIDLLKPKKILSYEEMTYFLQVISLLYPEFTKLAPIGKSVEGKIIYAMRIGNGKKEVLLDASMHAREHMTTNVLAEMIDTYSIHYENKSIYAGYNVRNTLDQTSIWFVPMMNPDGVTLVQSGAKSLKYGSLATKINGASNFNRWKANIRGVDLNDNFSSRWEKIKGGNKKPAYMAYKGPSAFSEPEAKALREFVKNHAFKTYISYHSSGQIMYWFNYQKPAQMKRDKTLASGLSKMTGYKVMPPQYLPGSGSSADWFIQQTQMPGITLEISPYIGEKPVPLEKWDAIWRQNNKVGLYLALEASKR